MGRSPLRQVLLSKRTYGAHYSILKEGSRGCVAQARSTPRMGHHLQLYRAQLSAANTDRQRTAHAQTVLLQRCLSTPKGFGGSFSRLRKNRGLLSMTAPSEPPSKTRSDLSISRAHRHHLEHQQSFIGLPQSIQAMTWNVPKSAPRVKRTDRHNHCAQISPSRCSFRAPKISFPPI